MASQPLPKMTLREYLDFEERSPVRHEYFDGEVFEVEAATFRHQQISTQLCGYLRPQLNAKGCEIHTSGTRVATGKQGLYTYPDLVVFCGKPQSWPGDPDTLSNPRILIEILSNSSKDYDRGTKFQLYRSLPSLTEYLNVHQEAPYIEHHVKQPDGSWLMRDLEGRAATLRLESVGIEVPFAAIYEGIEFGAVS